MQPGGTRRCERGIGHPGDEHWAGPGKAHRWGRKFQRSELAKPALERDLARDRAARKRQPKQPRCSVCMQPGELERGKCKDTAACAERAPQLDIGLEP